MTEEEWLTGTDPERMVKKFWGKISTRKGRLIACACVRHLWHLVREDERFLVDLVESFIEGTATKRDFDALSEQVLAEVARSEKVKGPGDWDHPLYAARACLSWGSQCLEDTVYDIPSWSLVTGRREIKKKVLGVMKQSAIAAGLATRPEAKGRSAEEAEKQATAAEKKVQCDLLRDILGNPFRPVTFDPSWRTPTVSALGQAIYDERRFADLPILADALEEAGCTNPEILGHCRHTIDHARGCWIIDLVLGKL